jgi:hypothetical protein
MLLWHGRYKRTDNPEEWTEKLGRYKIAREGVEFSW